MAWPVAKAKTPTSGLGNERFAAHAVMPNRRAAASGFTLIEIMVVMAIVGIAMAVVSLALRDPAATRLEREAVRLAALLEMARAESRASGMPVLWVPGSASLPGAPSKETAADFQFLGLSANSGLATRWLEPEVRVQMPGQGERAKVLRLGPEAIIDAQQVVLSLGQQSIVVSTSGLTEFAASAVSAAP
jgi:general secretion pathway protein H